MKETLSEEETEDEGVNRSSSMLACLKQIALISPICEKRAIALLFQAVKEQFLDKDLVKKVKRRNKFNWYLFLRYCGVQDFKQYLPNCF